MRPQSYFRETYKILRARVSSVVFRHFWDPDDRLMGGAEDNSAS